MNTVIQLSTVFFAAAFLAGCASQTVGPPVFIHDKTYIPIPATLTLPVAVDLTQATWGSAVGDLKAGLDTCNGKLDAIRLLAPPL